MNDFFNVSHISTVVVALVGWFVVHRLTAWRDRLNHKRKISTDFLIEAFQNLANAANRDPSPHYFRAMEAAVADIQLFGSTSQIKMIETFTTEFAEKGHASMDPLLNSLRKDLRKELKYEAVEGGVRWWRPEGSPKIAPQGAQKYGPRP